MRGPLSDIADYEVEAELGRGAMGVVYRVRRRGSNRLLALKMLLYGRGASFTELVRFRIEAEALSCLDHPNIVRIRDFGWHDGCPFFVLDYAQRGSLKQALHGGPWDPRPAAKLTWTLALAMYHAHERGMLHRDLKPANVLLMADGTPVISDFGLVKFADPARRLAMRQQATFSLPADTELARLARELRAEYDHTYAASSGDRDTSRAGLTQTSYWHAESRKVNEEDATRTAWGRCAKRTGLLDNPGRLNDVREFLTCAKEQPIDAQMEPEYEAMTQTNAILGSPSYMAPEQAMSHFTQIGTCTDIHALGIILYELLTGQSPFCSGTLFEVLDQVRAKQPASPRELNHAVSSDLAAVCLRCLEKSPKRRYRTAAALAEDLSNFLDGLTPKAARRSWGWFGARKSWLGTL